eukprot:1049775-Alexandrium_andersonii.AAC.1
MPGSGPESHCSRTVRGRCQGGLARRPPRTRSTSGCSSWSPDLLGQDSRRGSSGEARPCPDPCPEGSYARSALRTGRSGTS